MAVAAAGCALCLVLFTALAGATGLISGGDGGSAASGAASGGASGGAAGAAGLTGSQQVDVCSGPQTVGATEYGGPGDPSSGSVGASGVNLYAQPLSFAELGGTTVATATDLGGLPFDTPLAIAYGQTSLIAYKQDIGLGGGPIAGHPRVIDLWWRLAAALGIPYEHGRWSGTVTIAPLAGECDG